MPNDKIPISKFNVNITSHELTLNVSGDWHYGLLGITKEKIIDHENKKSDQYRGNIFKLKTGDLGELHQKNSVGHNYDINISDPQIQIDDLKEIMRITNEYMYGKTIFNKIKLNSNTNKRSAGVGGNHEFRIRKNSGIWAAREIYDAGKIAHFDTDAIIILNISNKKIKLSKTYKIYLSHWPYKTRSTSKNMLIRAMKQKRCDVPGCDLYVYGHGHQKIIEPDGYFDTDTGLFKKVLYIMNPSPVIESEYADVANYSPLFTDYSLDVFLPLDKNLFPYGTI